MTGVKAPPWRHTLCLDCYREVGPPQEPVVVLDALPEPCCRCHLPFVRPIYYSAEPDAFECLGYHP